MDALVLHCVCATCVHHAQCVCVQLHRAGKPGAAVLQSSSTTASLAYSAENWMTLLGGLLINSLVKALSTPARSEGTTICSSRGATSLSYCLLPPHPALNFQNQILK